MDMVSVVVTTKDSERTLARCLASIRAQDYPSIELLVVDNHSTDATVSIAQAQANKLIVAGPERCTQRNIGAREASGEFLLIVDSDMYLKKDVISQCVATMKGSVAGVVIPEKSFGDGFWAACKAYERDFYVRDILTSAARFFRRQMYLELGGFDEGLVSGEDWDLTIRLEPRGSVAIADSLIYHDEGHLSLGRAMQKKFYYGRHIYGFIRKHGNAAMKRLNPVRASYFSGHSAFTKDPKHAMGMIFMRACEASAGLAGLLVSGLMRA